MSPALVIKTVISRSRGTYEKHLVVHRADLQRVGPVRRTGRHIELRRQKDHFRTAYGHRAKELRKAYVKADRRAHAPKFRVEHRDAKDEDFLLLKTIMKRLEKAFPTFAVRKNTDKELGRKLIELGYERKRQTKGSSFRMKEK